VMGVGVQMAPLVCASVFWGGETGGGEYAGSPAWGQEVLSKPRMLGAVSHCLFRS
jgi:hypothetical protein